MRCTNADESYDGESGAEDRKGAAIERNVGRAFEGIVEKSLHRREARGVGPVQAHVQADRPGANDQPDDEERERNGEWPQERTDATSVWPHAERCTERGEPRERESEDVREQDGRECDSECPLSGTRRSVDESQREAEGRGEHAERSEVIDEAPVREDRPRGEEAE